MLEAPKLAPRRVEMEQRLSDAVGAPVTVKGKRAEGLGALGRREGIACFAVALVTGEAERADGEAAAQGHEEAGRSAQGADPPLADAGPSARGRPWPAGRRAPRGQAGRRGGPARATSKRQGLGGDQVEGRQAVRELLLARRRRVREVWLLAEQDPSDVLADIVELAESERVPVRSVGSDQVLRRGSLRGAARRAGQGGAARPRRRSRTSPPLAAGVPPFLVAVDGVTDPGNLGALLRSAECAGATGIVLPRHRAVHVTPTVTKAAAGAVEHLRFAVVGGLPAALQQLSSRGVWVVGLDGDAPTGLWDLPAADGPIALVLGAEGSGLSRLVRQRCDELVSIPLRRGAGLTERERGGRAGVLRGRPRPRRGLVDLLPRAARSD